MADSPILSIIGPSGLDSSAIIDALVNVRRNPIRRLEAQRARLQKQTTELGTLKTRLSALRSKAASFDTPAELRASTATSSDSTVISAIATGSANEGTYALNVTALAQADSKLSTGVSQKTGLAIGSGKITLASAGKTYDIQLTDPTDLEGIKNAINASEAPVTASIIDDGSGTNQFKLVLTADSTGTAASFTVDTTSFVPSGGAFSFSTLAAASDAAFTLNGIPVTRGSNTVTDVVQGVTLTFQKTGSATVGVSRDRAKVKERIKELVNAFNDVIDLFRANSRSENKDTTAVLYGDPTLRSGQSAIRGVIDEQVTAAGNYQTLASVGIKTGADGKLSVDDTQLSAALDADYDGVVALFTTANSGIAQKVQSVMLTYENNSIRTRTDSIRNRIRGINEQVNGLEDRLDKYIEHLRKKYADLDAISGRLQAQGAALAGLGG
jgi:flagellar hook-associated protein 2